MFSEYLRTPVTNELHSLINQQKTTLLYAVTPCSLGNRYRSYGENAAAPLGQMKARSSFEILVRINQTLRRHTADVTSHICIRKNLKPHTWKLSRRIFYAFHLRNTLCI